MATSRPQLRGEGLRSLLPMVKYSAKNTPENYRNLVSLRASAINDCHACITTHRRDARNDGWSQQRILQAEDWTNYADSFSEDEQLVLQLTDAVTFIDGYESVPDTIWDGLAGRVGDEGALNILVSILAINSFNRLNITTRTDPHIIKGTIDFDLDYNATP